MDTTQEYTSTEHIRTNDELSVAYSSERGGIVFSLSDKPLAPKQKPTTPIIQSVGSSNEFARWGEDNLFPQQVMADIEKNDILGPVLDWKARALYSGGLQYGIRSYEGKEEIFTPFFDPEIEQWCRRTNLNRYGLEASQDFYFFYNVFPEMILSLDRKKIIGLWVQEAMFCRWSIQNKTTGMVDYCYVNANWETNPGDYKQNKIRVIDPYYYAVESVQAGSDFKYIYPLSYPTPGRVYYQLAHWNAVRESGWLDVANAVPAYKKYLFENQINAVYHVEVATWWWIWKYPDWERFTAEEKRKLVQAEVDAFEKKLRGVEKSGSTLMTASMVDQAGKLQEGWKISVINDRYKSGMYVEDSQEACSHLLFALGVDPTLIGSAPGKGMGAGSGSDKREAFNMYISLCQAHVDIILEPLYFISHYNGWSDRLPGLTWRFRQPILQTLDQVTPSKRETKHAA